MTLIQFLLATSGWFAALERLPARPHRIGTTAGAGVGVRPGAMRTRRWVGAKYRRWCSRSAASRWRCDHNDKGRAFKNARPSSLTDDQMRLRAGMR